MSLDDDGGGGGGGDDGGAYDGWSGGLGLGQTVKTLLNANCSIANLDFVDTHLMSSSKSNSC